MSMNDQRRSTFIRDHITGVTDIIVAVGDVGGFLRRIYRIIDKAIPNRWTFLGIFRINDLFRRQEPEVRVFKMCARSE